MYYVYIIRSKIDNHLYIGQTKDVEKRLLRHNNKKVPITRSRAPFELLCTKSFETRGEAMKIEKLLKKQKGGNGLYKILHQWGLAKW